MNVAVVGHEFGFPRGHAASNYVRLMATGLASAGASVRMPPLADHAPWANVTPARRAPRYALLCADFEAYAEDAVFAVDALASSGVADLELLLVGRMPAETAARVAEAARRGRLQERVTSRTTHVPEAELRALYAGAAALLARLHDDDRSRARFPSRISEYLMAGRPVVAGAAGDVPLYLADGESAFLAARSGFCLANFCRRPRPPPAAMTSRACSPPSIRSPIVPLSRCLLFATSLMAACASRPAPPAGTSGGTRAGWIARSNAEAEPMLALLGRWDPEEASTVGLELHDPEVTELAEGHAARERADFVAAAGDLRGRMARESEPHVRQDLAILLRAAEQRVEVSLAHEMHEMPFHDVARMVFGGIHALLDDRVGPARHPAAIVRLRRYAGLEPGTRPLVTRALEETRAALATRRMPPVRAQIDKVLQTGGVLLDGVADLFARHHLTGHEEALGALRAQLAEYDAFVRAEVLPRARVDFRMAPEVYAAELRALGVDASPGELVALGHQGFDRIQREMEQVAAAVARARNLPSANYRDVLRALKQEQIADADLLPTYRHTLQAIEAIVRRERLVTLPQRPARIRLGTAAESAQVPAPQMRSPRLLGNTGEVGEFVLPVRVPMAPGAATGKLDDFSFPAATWTLAAHEARPGHELQFASLVEKGVSTARAVFAFNSANVEGWGLYAEYIVYPYMPPEGQLVSLQLRLHRAARAFLDPELQQGKRTPDEARAFLEREVGLSPAFANSEVERYTFWAPGQATSYFYGFTQLLAIRSELASRRAGAFDVLRFNDFVLDQGLLPPPLLREAALRELADARGER